MTDLTVTDSAPPILCKISLALREIIAVTSKLEKAMLLACGSDNTLSHQPVALQDFDFILQSLGEIATLLDGLDREGMPRTPADQAAVIAQIRLAWLRQLMGEETDQLTAGSPKISIF